MTSHLSIASDSISEVLHDQISEIQDSVLGPCFGNIMKLFVRNAETGNMFLAILSGIWII